MVVTRICVAVALQRYLDFTPVAVRQREVARLLALASGSTVTVVSVDAPVELLPDVETTAEKLERYLEPLRGDGLRVEAIQRSGQPSAEILAVVSEVGADLLIMGSHSKRGPFDVGLGSTVAALPRDLEVPVLLVRPSVADHERARELMIPRYPVVFPYG